MKRILLAFAIAAVAIGALYAATLAGAGVECEACVSYEGRDSCSTATGATRDDAERSAISTACAVVALGVTPSIECQRLEPRSLRCTER